MCSVRGQGPQRLFHITNATHKENEVIDKAWEFTQKRDETGHIQCLSKTCTYRNTIHVYILIIDGKSIITFRYSKEVVKNDIPQKIKYTIGPYRFPLESP